MHGELLFTSIGAYALPGHIYQRQCIKIARPTSMHKRCCICPPGPYTPTRVLSQTLPPITFSKYLIETYQ